MLRTFGLELVNFHPAWKVPKGSRSASRRARKTVCESLKNCTRLINRNSESSNMPVSGSEKRGASMIDWRFSEKAEHIPIKKRRFLLRSSPSPPPQPPVTFSQCTEETRSHPKSHDDSEKCGDMESAVSDINSSQIIGNTVSLEDQKSGEANKSFGEGEDFSGISILAAAACSSSFGRDCSDTKDGLVAGESSPQGKAGKVSPIVDAHLSTNEILKEDLPSSSEMPTGGALSCAVTEPFGEIVSISTSVNSSQNVTAGQGAQDNSLKMDPLTVSGDASCSMDEGRVGNRKKCFRDDRFHWDLNVMMDAWEEPIEPLVEHNDIPPNASQDPGKSSHDDKMENLKVHDLWFKLASTCAAQDCALPGEPKILGNQSLEENKLNLDISNCDYVVQRANLDEKPLLSDCNKNLNVVGEDSKSIPSDRSIIAALDPATHPSASGAINEDDGVCVKSPKLNDDEHPKERPNLEGLNLRTSGSHCMLENVGSLSASDGMQPKLGVSSSSDIWMEVRPDLSILGNKKTSQELQYDRGAIAENVGIRIAEALQQPQFAPGRGDVSHSSMCVEVPNSLSTKCEVLAALDVKEQDFGYSKGKNDTIGKVSDTSSVSQEACEASHDNCRAILHKSSNCLGQVDAAQAPSQNDDGNVCCHPYSAVGTVAKIELQEAYDSQYEDGELREPNERHWEDREVERVDYESDDMGACTVDPTGYLVSESGQVEDRENYGPEEAAIVSASVCNVDSEVVGEAAKPLEADGPLEEENRVKSNPQSEEKMKKYVSKELLAGRSSSSDMDIGLSDDEGGKDRLASHADGDGIVDSQCAEARVESKPFRRGLQSRIEGPVAHDTSSREERLNRMESRYEETTSLRSFQRARCSFHNQANGRQADGWDGFSDNRRGFRHHYSPIMHRHSRLDDDANMERDDLGYSGGQDDVSYSRHFLSKSRSGGTEDDCAGLHSRCRPNRTFSPGRPSTFGRGRSIRYGSLVENRAGRGRYNGPSPDDSFQSSLKYRRPLSQRERSFSPFGGRGHSNAHHSRGKSPSQSRSRSPIMWSSSRGRTGSGSGGSTFVRHRIRSPNFGSDVRMQRLRSAHHQPRVAPDDTVGFGSISRNRGSPPHERWNSAGKEYVGHFRDFAYKQRSSGLERSPGRIRLRGDRAGIFDPPRTLKSNGYRISDDASSGGPRYEENYEGRRKHYGPLHPARRSYEDNMAGRLHQDIDDGFSLPKSIRDRDFSDFQGRGFRGIDSRINDLPRRFRGEQHSFMCEQDGKFNSNSKQFGVDDMDSSRNLKSEEQYRSSHAGRFTNMDGFNRGCRYDNFDRRKLYDPPNLMKRCDTDGLEMRLNHNLDERFQDASDFCGRPMRSFDVRTGSLSTRLREDKDSAGCGQEKNLEDNPQ